MPPDFSKSKPKIIVLDGYTLNPGDLSWEPLRTIGDVQVFDYTPPEVVSSRSADADILVVNKVRLGSEVLLALPRLRCVAVTATGYNNVDIAAARTQGIVVCNARAYSTEAVVQHVFALLLELTNAVGAHNHSVQTGHWSAQPHFAYTLQPIHELYGKVMGIYGFGNIGQRVGEVARAFGMEVLAVHKHPERDARPWVRFVSLEELFVRSDVVSLHAPLSTANEGIVNAHLLRLMKPEAMLINTGRGGLINEKDLRHALEAGWLAGAALDVLTAEPPPPDHPLLEAPRCLITPHIAWASVQARRRLMDITVQNVTAFLNGAPQNVVS